METKWIGGELMPYDKFEPIGEIIIRGKVAKIVLDAKSKDPVRFFCFLNDLEKLVDGKFTYAQVFRDSAPADRFAEP